MNPCYDIDSTKITHREYWWGNKSPLVLLGWIIKWLTAASCRQFQARP